MTTEVKGVLTFVKWYTKQAVYLDDKLIQHGEHKQYYYDLFNLLGYECYELGEIPTHFIPQEFDVGSYKHWLPPSTLTVLKDQFSRWKLRTKTEELQRAIDFVTQLQEEVNQWSSRPVVAMKLKEE